MNRISLLSRLLAVALFSLFATPATAGVFDAEILKRNRVSLAQLIAGHKDLSLAKLLRSDVALADDHGLKFYFITYEAEHGPRYFYLIDVNILEDHHLSSLFFYNGEGTFPNTFLPENLIEADSDDAHVYAGEFDPETVDLGTFTLDSGYEISVEMSVPPRVQFDDQYTKSKRSAYKLNRVHELEKLISNPGYIKEVSAITNKIDFFRKRTTAPQISDACTKFLNEIIAKSTKI